MQLLYVPNIEYPLTTLDESESRHAVAVMRMKEGDPVHLVDGKGGLYQAVIALAHPKRCTLSILSSQQNFEQRNHSLHIAIAPTKSIDRMEWFCEKATELGIDEITPIHCDHSERKIIKPDRLKKILVSAMKQSQKAFLPTLHPMIPLHQFILNCKATMRFIAHCQPGEKEHLKNVAQPRTDTVILIGPEGDFSPEETALATLSGYKEVSLGNSRLRTETAGIAACHIINLINT